MKGATIAVGAILALLSGPALAEPRWLSCKYTDISGKGQTFQLVFDDLRGIASLFDAGAGALVEGSDTSINFQSLRTRFPAFSITYNRNDGALAVTPPSGGILHGECRRSPPPPGAPSGPG
jgi:hypothetical protein